MSDQISATFREAVKPAPIVETTSQEQANDSVEESKEHKAKDTGSFTDNEIKSLSPLLYMQEKGLPYVAKYLGAESLVENLDHDTVINMEMIDDYFKQEVENSQYVNDDISFKECMKKLEKMTNTQGAPLRTKVGQIAEFVKYLMRAKKYGTK